MVATAADTGIPLYLVTANAGTTGSAVYVLSGEAACEFDNSTSGKGGSYVVVGTGGRCHQTDTAPTPGIVAGTLNDDSTTNGQTSLVDFNNVYYSAPPGAGSGTMTSLQVTMPVNEFTVAPSTAITTSGIFAVSKTNVNANCVMAGPISGGPAAWTCRNLVLADIPSGVLPTGTAAGDLAGTYPNPTVAKASAQFDFAGLITAAIPGNPTHDWSPTGWQTATIVRATSTTDVRLTGLAAPQSPAGSGNLKNICNATATFTITLGNLASGSSPNNQLALAPANLASGQSDDLTLPPGQCKPLWYDGTAGTLRWKLWDGTPEDYLKLRPFSLLVGDPDPSSAPLLDGNDSPTVWTNMYRRPLMLLALACKADAAGLTIRPILSGVAGATSIVSSDCSCGAGVFQACALNGNPILQPAAQAGATCPTAPAAPCSLDFNIQTAGGTAKVVIGNFEAILK